MSTIPEIMRTHIGTQVPEALRSAVTDIFLKGPKGNLSRWQKDIIENPNDLENKIRHIKIEYSPAIYNAIILCHLLGDRGKVRTLFDAYNNKDNKKILNSITLIKKRFEQHFAEFFCLGIIPESLDEIIEQLESQSINILKDRLSNPYYKGALKSLVKFYGKEIPWLDYHNLYGRAHSAYRNNQLEQAAELLSELKSLSIVRLPVAETLQKRVQQKIEQANSYFDYLQKNL